jgi:hypothetical protein
MGRRDRERERQQQDDYEAEMAADQPADDEEEEYESESEPVDEGKDSPDDEFLPPGVGLGMEVKAGLAVILLMVGVLGWVLWSRMHAASDQTTATAKTDAKEPVKSSASPDKAATVPAPTLMAAQPPKPHAGKRTSVADMDKWNAPAGLNHPGSKPEKPQSAGSFMPKVLPPGGSESKPSRPAESDPIPRIPAATNSQPGSSDFAVPAMPAESTFSKGLPTWENSSREPAERSSVAAVAPNASRIPPVSFPPMTGSERKSEPEAKANAESAVDAHTAPDFATIPALPTTSVETPSLSAQEPPKVPPTKNWPSSPAASGGWGSRAPAAEAENSIPGGLPAGMPAVPPAMSRARPQKQSAPSGGRVYVVREGDTLMDIARQELGKATRWVEIYDLNSEILGDHPTQLRPGTRLVLPEDRSSAMLTDPPGFFRR